MLTVEAHHRPDIPWEPRYQVYLLVLSTSCPGGGHRSRLLHSHYYIRRRVCFSLVLSVYLFLTHLAHPLSHTQSCSRAVLLSPSFFFSISFFNSHSHSRSLLDRALPHIWSCGIVLSEHRKTRHQVKVNWSPSTIVECRRWALLVTCRGPACRLSSSEKQSDKRPSGACPPVTELRIVRVRPWCQAR